MPSYSLDENFRGAGHSFGSLQAEIRWSVLYDLGDSSNLIDPLYKHCDYQLPANC